MSEMELTTKDRAGITGNAFFVYSQIEHKLLSKDTQLTILINPLSSIGHQLFLKFKGLDYSAPYEGIFGDLMNVLNLYQSNNSSIEKTFSEVKFLLNQYKYSYEHEIHPQDDRITKALDIMDNNFDKIYSLEDISAICYLSPSRFLHLFKEKTAINFRRYQLWNKLIKSLPHLQRNSITETAHAAGFSDSSHYTRTFKETFGVNPTFILQKR
jgi:AraC-like DNA-binding protein